MFWLGIQQLEICYKQLSVASEHRMCGYNYVIQPVMLHWEVMHLWNSQFAVVGWHLINPRKCGYSGENFIMRASIMKLDGNLSLKSCRITLLLIYDLITYHLVMVFINLILQEWPNIYHKPKTLCIVREAEALVSVWLFKCLVSFVHLISSVSYASFLCVFLVLELRLWVTLAFFSMWMHRWESSGGTNTLAHKRQSERKRMKEIGPLLKLHQNAGAHRACIPSLLMKLQLWVAFCCSMRWLHYLAKIPLLLWAFGCPDHWPNMNHSNLQVYNLCHRMCCKPLSRMCHSRQNPSYTLVYDLLTANVDAKTAQVTDGSAALPWSRSTRPSNQLDSWTFSD